MAVILSVDDDPLLCAGIECTLRREPHQVLAAHSASEAQSLLAARPIDIVIADERMPGQQGSEFLGIVAQAFPAVVRILLTGWATTEVALRAVNEGRVFRILEKPYPGHALLKVIDAALPERAALLRRWEGEDGGGITRDLRERPSLACLSQRECEIVQLLANGSRPKRIAQELSLSPHTVRNHLRSVFQKLHVRSQQALLDVVRRPRRHDARQIDSTSTF